MRKQNNCSHFQIEMCSVFNLPFISLVFSSQDICMWKGMLHELAFFLYLIFSVLYSVPHCLMDEYNTSYHTINHPPTKESEQLPPSPFIGNCIQLKERRKKVLRESIRCFQLGFWSPVMSR